MLVLTIKNNDVQTAIAKAERLARLTGRKQHVYTNATETWVCDFAMAKELYADRTPVHVAEPD